MKDEQLLQLLGEIDEKHLLGANRDIERWLEEQNGVEFKVERPRKKSPWKIIAAVSCSAAAVLGAFVLARNITKLDSIGNSGNTGDPLFTNNSAEQSLSLDDYEIENLDYSNALYFENTPNSGHWKRLSYQRTPFGEQSADKLVKMAADYGVTIDKDDIMVARIIAGRTETTPLSDADFENYYYHVMYYDSDELHIDTIPGSGVNYVELNNKKNVRDILGKDWEFGSWRPSMESEYYRAIDPFDEEETCVLNGKTVKVADAVRNAQKMIEESDVFPKGFDITIRSKVSRFEYENGCQCLWLEFTYTLDGVSYMTPPNRELDIEKVSDQAYSVHFYCGMLTENTLDWIWQINIDGSTEFTVEECEINVSQEDALKLVSQNLDQNDMFKVREIQLVYADRLTDGGKTLCIEPTWMIYLSNDESWKTERIYAYVNAADGKTQVYRMEP